MANRIMNVFAFPGLVLIIATCIGCQNKSTDAPVSDSAWEQHVEQYLQQLEKNDEMLSKSEEQAQRIDELLDRQNGQADRYDNILDKWENQSLPKQ